MHKNQVATLLAIVFYLRYTALPFETRMSRYKYHPPFRISHQYDCNFWPKADTVEEAVMIALEKHPACRISVYAEAVYDGITVSRADVGIYAYDADGKSYRK